MKRSPVKSGQEAAAGTAEETKAAAAVTAAEALDQAAAAAVPAEGAVDPEAAEEVLGEGADTVAAEIAGSGNASRLYISYLELSAVPA